MTEVVAALIWKESRFLICQRPAHKTRGLLWEFTVEVEDIFMELIHTYPDLTVHLTLFHAKIESGTPQLLEHNAIRWISTGQICQYDFCPADQGILQALQDGKK